MEQDADSDCVLWTGAMTKWGYGKITLKPPGGKMTVQTAHRVSYRLFNGEIPEGLVIKHLCNRPICVNPAHLEADTTGNNTRDAHRDGIVKYHRGEARPNHKLTDEDIPVILARIKQGDESLRAIARSYGVRHGTISQVLTGKAWSHVSGIKHA